MIVLDTNVLSEPLKARPDERVLAWLGSVEDIVRVTAVTVGELLVGVRRLEAGRRRDALLAVIEDTIGRFSGSILVYDEPAARRYASMQESRRLNRRLAELTDIVQELLVPLSLRDEDKINEYLQRYSSSL